MYLAKVLSNLNGWNSIRKEHSKSFAEIESVIESIQPQWDEYNLGGASLGRRLISASGLSKQSKHEFNRLGWIREKRKFGTKPNSGISMIDAVKDKLGVEYLFGKFAFAESDIFVKFPIFIQAGIIDAAVILMPTKSLTNYMMVGSNIGNVEMLENRFDEIPSLLPKYPFIVGGVSHEPSNFEVRELNNPANLSKRSLQVFLCHSSGDKPLVRELHKRLAAQKNIDPWLDEFKLLPGVDWNNEITQAVKESDVVIVCLSKASISKEGYVQKEIRRALDVAEEKPDGTIFIIPLKVEDCEVPQRLSKWQWVNYYEDGAFDKLISSLQRRARSLGIEVE